MTDTKQDEAGLPPGDPRATDQRGAGGVAAGKEASPPADEGMETVTFSTQHASYFPGETAAFSAAQAQELRDLGVVEGARPDKGTQAGPGGAAGHDAHADAAAHPRGPGGASTGRHAPAREA